ncbi:hypothetical protein OWR28_02255 [Chryseobacterium sp. 1B4]
MKKSIFTVSACIGLLAVATSFSSAEIADNNKKGAELSDTAPKTQTYKIRYGLLSKAAPKFFQAIMM